MTRDQILEELEEVRESRLRIIRNEDVMFTQGSKQVQRDTKAALAVLDEHERYLTRLLSRLDENGNPRGIRIRTGVPIR